MSKIIETKINSFFGGISDDPRSTSDLSPAQFTVSKHFDIFSYPKKLVPQRDNVADENDGSTPTGMKTRKVQDFAYDPTTPTIWGLGTKSDGTGMELFSKAALTTSSWTSRDDDTATLWRGSLNLIGALPYFFGGTNQVFFFSGGVITALVGTLAATILSVAQGVNAKDGFLYMPYGRRLAKITGATLAEAPIVLSINSTITSICNYGNYIAIAATKDGRSKVYIWDLVSANPTEVIDWGEGDLKVLENLDGILVGVSDENMSTTQGNDKGKMVIRSYSGGSPVIEKEIEALYTGGYVRLSKAIKGGRIRFAAAVPQSASEKMEGIWSFGRKSVGYPNALTIEVIEEDADADGIDSFAQFGNFDFIAHSNDGSIQRTSDTDTFTYTSIYQSQIFNGGDSDLVKDLLSAAVTFEPLPTAGQVVLKYRKDEETSFTTLFTETTDGAVSRKCVNTAAGTNLPSFKEITFRIESTGGAVITGFKFAHEIESDKAF